VSEAGWQRKIRVQMPKSSELTNFGKRDVKAQPGINAHITNARVTSYGGTKMPASTSRKFKNRIRRYQFTNCRQIVTDDFTAEALRLKISHSHNLGYSGIVHISAISLHRLDAPRCSRSLDAPLSVRLATARHPLPCSTPRVSHHLFLVPALPFQIREFRPPCCFYRHDRPSMQVPPPPNGSVPRFACRFVAI
jgi:hypothetical protein